MTPRTFVVRVAAYGRASDGRRDYRSLVHASSAAPSCVYDAVLVEQSRGRTRAVRTLDGRLLPPALFEAATYDPSPVRGLFWAGLSAAGRRRLAAVFAAGEAWLITIASTPIWRLFAGPRPTAIDEFEETLPVDARRLSVTHDKLSGETT